MEPKMENTRDIVIRIETIVGEIKDDVLELKKCVNGNGTPGLKSSVQALENDMKDMNKRHDEEDKTKRDISGNIRSMWLAIIAELIVTGTVLVLKLVWR
jgi:hypothetical protein